MVATPEQRAVATCLAVVGVVSVAGVMGSTGVAVAVALAVAVTAAVSLFLDQFAGFIIGLAASAALILGRRLLGPWGDEEFWLALAQTAGLVAAGVTAGATGRRLRPRSGQSDQVGTLLPEPVFGSLGLLDAHVALDRLVEEVERARAHDRALTVLLLDVHAVDPSSAEFARSAQRAVSRIFESRLPETDVPFALAEDRLGAILPETTSAGAWERVGLVLDAVAAGRFGVRSEGREHPLEDHVRIEVGMSELRPGVADADALLDAATAALPRHDPTGGNR